MNPVPTMLPADLPEEARKLYREVGKDGNCLAGITDPVVKEAARTIARAGLGHYDDEQCGSLRIIELHPDFTVARSATGRGIYAEVWALPSWRIHSRWDEGALFAVLDGATLNMHESHGSSHLWRLKVIHGVATDFEHDPVHLAELQLVNPVLTDVWGDGRTEIVAVLAEAPRLYPWGVDPFAPRADDHDYVPGTCTEEQWDPHPFGRFMPPVRRELSALSGRFVRIVYGHRGVMVNDEPGRATADENEGTPGSARPPVNLPGGVDRLEDIERLWQMRRRKPHPDFVWVWDDEVAWLIEEVKRLREDRA